MNRRLTGFLFVAAALSVVAAPQATAGAKNPAKAAAKATCKAERAALGARLFRATYGSRPVGTCRRRVLDEAQEAVGSAAGQCAAERADDPVAFRAKYGTNGGQANAFGRCVARTAKKELRAASAATLNAARACKAERAEDPDAFRERYGTNPNKANAFGKCVSSKRAGDEEPEDEPDGDEPSGDDPGAGGGDGEA